MSDLLLELGSEELPARFVNPARSRCAMRSSRCSPRRGSTHGEPQSFGTPRRLAVLVPDVAERQPDLEQEVMGPPVKAAFDADGKPKPAAEGFAKSQGVELSALTRVQTPKGEYLAARVHEVGKPAADVLPGPARGAPSASSRSPRRCAGATRPSPGRGRCSGSARCTAARAST